MTITSDLLNELHADYRKADNARFVAELKTRNTLLACATTGHAPTTLQIAELHGLYTACVAAGLPEYATAVKTTTNILNAKK